MNLLGWLLLIAIAMPLILLISNLFPAAKLKCYATEKENIYRCEKL